jgi:hypothetical protein
MNRVSRETSERVYAAAVANPQMTRREIADACRISRMSVHTAFVAIRGHGWQQERKHHGRQVSLEAMNANGDQI